MRYVFIFVFDGFFLRVREEWGEEGGFGERIWGGEMGNGIQYSM